MAERVVVETNCGKIRGSAENGVNTFKGIPYAESPEGEGRFAAPRKLRAWTGVRDAFDFGNRAMQDENAFALPPAMLKLFAGRELPPMSENCLVLNVWTPAVNDGRKRPVMFWCHGGAFISGSGDSLIRTIDDVDRHFGNVVEAQDRIRHPVDARDVRAVEGDLFEKCAARRLQRISLDLVAKSVRIDDETAVVGDPQVIDAYRPGFAIDADIGDCSDDRLRVLVANECDAATFLVIASQGFQDGFGTIVIQMPQAKVDRIRAGSVHQLVDE